MSKHIMLALPLASLLFLVGCCADGSCYSSATGDTVYYGSTGVATAVAKDDVVIAVTDEEIEAETVAVAPVVVVTEKVPAQEVKQVEFTKEASTTKVMAKIPAMPLPEGWAYISESDLTNGQLNAVPIDEYYSHIASTEKNDI